eukprot:895381-Pleurochrysis_carterae.AAC.1
MLVAPAARRCRPRRRALAWSAKVCRLTPAVHEGLQLHAACVGHVGRHIELMVELMVEKCSLVDLGYVGRPTPVLLDGGLAPSPSRSRRSVATPMRQHLPPKWAGSSSHAAAIFFATRRDVVVVHAD